MRVRRLAPPRLGRAPRLALAGLCFAAATLIALESHDSHPAALVGVVISRHSLPAGAVLTEPELRVSRWPREQVPDGAWRAVSPLVGRRLAAGVTAGEVLTSARVVGRDLTRGLAPGLVAVTVRVAEPRLADLVHPGDRVDLYPVGAAGDQVGGPVPPAAVRPVAEAAVVLAVLPGTAGPDGSVSDLTDGGATPGDTVVVGVGTRVAAVVTVTNSSQMFAVVLDPP